MGLNRSIDADTLSKLRVAGIAEVPTLLIDGFNVSTSFRDTLELDKLETQDEAIIDIYRRLRPSNPPTQEVARTFFHNLFFSPEHYDLSAVGRLKLNLRLGLNVPEEERTLRRVDILAAVKELLHLKDTDGRSTTSTTWATAGCGRWASCWRTSTASAWCAWSAPSRSA